MKKILNLIIVFIILCGGIQALAYGGTPYGGTAPILTPTEELKVEVENYDNGGQDVAYYSTRSTKATSYRTDEYVAIAGLSGARGVSLTTTEWLKYTIDVRESGTYEMKLNAVALSASACINVYVDDVKVVNAKKMSVINPVGNYVPADNPIGEIELEEGTRVIKLENPDTFFYPNYFSLNKVASNEPYKEFILTDEITVEAEDYDMGGQNISYFAKDETYSENYRTDEYVKIVPDGNDYSVSLQTDEWVEYTIIGNEPGLFLITLNSADKLDIYVNDIARAEKTKTAAIEIQNGKNVIKIKNSGETAKIDNFKLQKLENSLPYTERYFDGEEPLVIEAEDFDIGRKGEAWLDNTDGGTGLYRFDSDIDIVEKDGGYAVELDKDEWAGYTVNSSVSGSYSLWLNAGPISKAAKISTRNGDLSHSDNIYVFANGSADVYQYIGEVKLDEGDNKIVIENPYSVKLTVDNVVLKKNEAEPFAEINVPGEILPHLYDVGGMYNEKSNPNGGYSSPFRFSNGLGKNLVRPYDYIFVDTLGADYYISAQPSDWVKYTVNASKSGKYAFYMRGQISAGSGKMDLYVNDEQVVEERIIPITKTVTDTFIGVIELNEGKNTIRSDSVGGSGYFFTKFLVKEIQPSEMKSVDAVSENNTWRLEENTLVDADITKFVVKLSNPAADADGAATLTGNGRNIPLTASVEDGDIIFTLGDSLEYNTEYTLHISENGIEDLYGNKIEKSFEWKFVTAGAEIEVTSVNIKGTTAEVTVRNNGYTDAKSAVVLFASYNDDGIKEIAPTEKKTVLARKTLPITTALTKPLDKDDKTVLYVWDSLEKLNPIYGINAASGGIKKIILQEPYVDYDEQKLILNGSAVKGETVTYLITKPGKKASETNAIYDVGEVICGEDGTFNVEVLLTNAEPNNKPYGIYIGGNKLEKAIKSEILLFEKTDVGQAAKMLKDAKNAEEIKTLLGDTGLKAKEKLGLTNPLYDKVDNEKLSLELYERRNEIDLNNLNSVKNVFDEALIVLYFEEAESAEELKNALEEYGMTFGLKNAFLYTEYTELSDDEQIKVCDDMRGKEYKIYNDILKEFSMCNIRHMLNTATSYNDVEEILDMIYEYVNAKSLYNTYKKSSNKQDIEKYIVLNYNAKNIKTPDDVKDLLSKAISANMKTSEKPSYSSGGGGGGSKSSGGMQLTTYPQVQTTVEKALPFNDVSTAHWAYEYIKALFEKEIINGKSTNSYCPEDAVTREEFVKIAVGAFSLTAKSDNVPEFEDVPKTAWYYNYVTAAASNNIINGIDKNNFGTGGKITRQQAAAIIYRIIGDSATEMNGKISYGDYEQIEDYAKDATSALTEYGIIAGDTDGMFRPSDYLTRAEAAKIIYQTNKFLAEVRNEK